MHVMKGRDLGIGGLESVVGVRGVEVGGVGVGGVGVGGVESGG